MELNLQNVLGHGEWFFDHFDEKPVLDFIFNDVMRGVGQCLFCNNPISGMLFLTACFIETNNQVPACYGILAVVLASLYTRFENHDRGARRAGLFGFNPFLIGLAIHVFLDDTNGKWTPNIPQMCVVAILPIFSVSIQVALNSRMIPNLKTPCFTLPFCVCVICFLLEAERPQSVFSPNYDLIQPSPIVPPEGGEGTGRASITDLTLAQFWEGSLKGISQVIFINNMYSGLVMLCGIGFYSRVSMVVAYIASLIGILVAVLIGSHPNDVAIGLWGYNSVLSCMAVGGIFVVLKNAYSFIVMMLTGVGSTFIYAMLTTLLKPWGISPLTVPFCTATILFMVATASSKKLVFRPLDRITTPEEHYDQLITSRFDKNGEIPPEEGMWVIESDESSNPL